MVSPAGSRPWTPPAVISGPTPITERWRLFIAVFPPQDWQEPIASLQHSLARQLHPAPIRWVRPEQIHVTLRFLGDVISSEVPMLVESLRATAADFSPFTLQATDLATFPDSRAPRVLWLGLAGNVDCLLQLHRRLDEETAAWGEPETSRASSFRPHLTIARIKAPAPKLLTILKSQDNRASSPPATRSPSGAMSTKRLSDGRSRTKCALSEACAWNVNHFELVRSELHPTGPEYTTLHRFPLPGTTQL